ncbi:chromate transporter [Alicyclobacillaceae bacterium I2511]|nr:chromate transporter [Alicyclobacillaceae bacterium I2511]
MSNWVALFWGFFKVGILGYGGGPGSISLIQAISVNGYHWMDNAQFSEMLAIGNALPGPIATKLAAAIGWRVGGAIGALMALIGIVGPSLILMLGMYQILVSYQSNSYVTGLIHGVKPIVVLLLVLVIWDFIPGAFPKNHVFMSLLLFVGGLIAVKGLNISPPWVILGAMVVGMTFMR